MKKTLFAIPLFIALIAAACGGAVGPKTLNTIMINAFSAANRTADTFDGRITEGVKSGDLASIAVAADVAIGEIDKQIEKVSSTVAPESGESYKESVISSLNTLKDIIETGKKYSSLGEGYSAKEFNALEKEYNAKRQQLSKELSEVANVAKAFCKANGI